MKPWQVIVIAAAGYSVNTLWILLVGFGAFLGSSAWGLAFTQIAMGFLLFSVYGALYSISYRRAALPLERVGDFKFRLWLQLHFLFWLYSFIDLFVIFMFMAGTFGIVLKVPLTLETFAPPFLTFSLLYAVAFIARTAFSNVIGMKYRTLTGDSPTGISALAALSASMLRRGDRIGLNYLHSALDEVIDDYRGDQIQSTLLRRAHIAITVGGHSVSGLSEDQLVRLGSLSKSLKEYPNIQPALEACKQIRWEFPWVDTFVTIPEPARSRYDTAVVAAASVASTAAVISVAFNMFPKEQLSGLFSALMSSTTLTLLIGTALSWLCFHAFREMGTYLVQVDPIKGLKRIMDEAPSR